MTKRTNEVRREEQTVVNTEASEYLDVLGENLDCLLLTIGPSDKERCRALAALSNLLEISNYAANDARELEAGANAMFRALVAQDPFTTVVAARLMHLGYALVTSTWLAKGGSELRDRLEGMIDAEGMEPGG